MGSSPSVQCSPIFTNRSNPPRFALSLSREVRFHCEMGNVHHSCLYLNSLCEIRGEIRRWKTGKGWDISWISPLPDVSFTQRLSLFDRILYQWSITLLITIIYHWCGQRSHWSVYRGDFWFDFDVWNDFFGCCENQLLVSAFPLQLSHFCPSLWPLLQSKIPSGFVLFKMRN